jgi:hypothetical protein
MKNMKSGALFIEILVYKYIEIVVYVYEKTRSYNKIKFVTEDYLSNHKNISAIKTLQTEIIYKNYL